ncbi:DUF4012 domain-containing protein [Candidatus Peregrinibacteria bacterium]|nr:DUF4012 domain-containing protein [Candidatus Peregrinibacteria bacterium]
MFVRDINQPASDKNRTQTIFVNESNNNRTVSRSLMYVLVFASVIVLGLNFIRMSQSGLRLKQSIIQSAGAGFEKIENGVASLGEANFETAKNLFAEAQRAFENIKSHAWFASPSIPGLKVKDPIFESASAIADAGKYLSQAGQYFARAAENLEFLPKIFFEENIKKPLLSSSRPSLTEKLKSQIPSLLLSADALAKANESLQKVPDAFVPARLRDRFKFAKNGLNALAEFTQNLQNDTAAVLSLLGDKEPHTFLVLLQNNAELRPSGGFIGDFAIIETNEGYITKNEVFDIYSADHLLAEKIPPPLEILPANQQWFMRDSNYSGHFPLSAQKAIWFLEKERGPGADTVIAIDQSFVAELLRLSGSMKIPELAQPLTAENFSTIISYIVESKLTGREDPKAILKSFMPEFQKALFKNADPAALLQFFKAAIESKHLLAYSKDPDVQKFWQRNHAAGLMKDLEPKEDYLNIVHTSISGNKSDDDVAEYITHNTYIKSDGSLQDELIITRKHLWNEETAQRIKNIVGSFGFSEISKKVWEIFGRSPNVNMLRIYVPKGAVLEDSAGFAGIETYFDEETNKTYFSARIDAPVSGSGALKILYRLPFRLNLDPIDKYYLAVQKQAGQENITFVKRIYPDSRVLNYKYFPEDGSFDPDGIWQFTSELKKDMTFSSVWGK